MTATRVAATKAEATAAAIAQASTDEDGRTTVHSVSIGSSIMLGADWDLEALVTEINKAVELVWFDDFMGHDLAMRSAGGQFYKFEVKRPAVES